MASSEDTFRVLLAVMLLIIGLGIFNAIFAQPELDQMAQQSAHAMADAINAAADLPFTTQEPTLDQETLYAVAPIRFGDPINLLTGWNSAWQGTEPRYEMFFEKFPDAQPMGFATTWTESYPWSGGMGSQLMFYGVMRFGLGTKIGRKILSAPVVLPFKAIYKGYKFFDSLPSRLYHSMNKGQAKFGVKWITRYLQKNPDSLLNARLKLKWADMATNSLYKKQFAQITNYHLANLAAETAVDQGTLNKKLAKNIANQVMEGRLVHDADGLLKIDINDMSKSQYQRLRAFRDALPNTRKGYQIAADELSFRDQFDSFFKTPPTDSYTWLKMKNWWKEAVNYKVTDWVSRRKTYKVMKDYQMNARIKIFEIKYGNKLMKDSMVLSSEDTATFYKAMNKKLSKLSPEAQQKLAMQLSDSFEDQSKIIRIFDDINSAQRYTETMLAIPDSPHYNAQRMVNKLRQSDVLEQIQANHKTTFNGLDPDFRLKITDICNENGIDNPAQFWNKKVYNQYGKFGFEGVQNHLYERAFDQAIKDPAELAKLSDAMLGNYETSNVWKAGQAAGNWGKNFVMFDFGKYKNPFWHGAYVTQQAAENQIGNLGVDTSNSVVFMQGAEGMVIPLDEEVDDYEVKLYRPKPGADDGVFPVHVQTGLFYASIVNNPRYYTVSPCFGIAKVWKEPSETAKGTIYVKIDKLCDVGDDECPNYCYATNDLIWGKINENSETTPVWGNEPFYSGVASFSTAFGGCLAAAVAKTAVGVPLTTADYKACAKFGAIVGGGVVLAEVAVHTGSDSCTSDHWGYWNYYVASDTIDWMETIGSFGSTGFLKSTAAGPTVQAAKSGLIKQGLGKLATDASLGPQLAGDFILSWPNIGWNKQGIDYQEILDNQGDCIWRR